jgi:autotransporter strand-loop-strand O-heptosyltransferase
MEEDKTITINNASNIPVAEGTSTQAQEKETFARPPKKPVFKAIDEIYYDFNNGLRVLFSENCEKEYRCVFVDKASGMIVYSMDIPKGACVESVKKYYVDFHLDIYEKGHFEKPVFSTDLNLDGRNVLVQFPYGAVGDTIAWFSYVERFQKKHNCKLTVSMEKRMADLFRNQYPEIEFCEKDDLEGREFYATYNLGLFFGGDVDHQPYDFRAVGLHRTIGYILGLDDQIDDIPPRVDLSCERQIKEKYVVIATQASSQCKYWNNPSGWRETIAYLKSLGYRVLCIDLNREYGYGFVWNKIPFGCEDFTGPAPLQERINLIKDADLFIGLSSGLSWLAWCCKVPIVMISGFTDPINEFHTPYRVINTHVCHGCWNDIRQSYDHHDFLWCPHKDEKKKFECTLAITSKMVIEKINKALEDMKNA